MATNEEIDDAEQLRFIALQSMVRKKKSKAITEETDDQDIRNLRAAALKSITHKSKTRNSLVVKNKDKHTVKGQSVNGKKRVINDQVNPLKNMKNMKLSAIKNSDSKSYITSDNTKKIKCDLEQKQTCISRLNPMIELQDKSEAVNKDKIQKIVKNGCIQLSNLNSENVSETMVLHITFSSSESDDSSNECDTIKKKIITDGKTVYNHTNNEVNIDDNLNKTVHSKSEENRLKVDNCMKTLTGLMKNCESEIEKRNQQVTILLEAYKKYQNYSESLYSIIETMKTVRDELSQCVPNEISTVD